MDDQIMFLIVYCIKEISHSFTGASINPPFLNSSEWLINDLCGAQCIYSEDNIDRKPAWLRE
jgi:hypothetical protein